MTLDPRIDTDPTTEASPDDFNEPAPDGGDWEYPAPSDPADAYRAETHYRELAAAEHRGMEAWFQKEVQDLRDSPLYADGGEPVFDEAGILMFALDEYRRTGAFDLKAAYRAWHSETFDYEKVRAQVLRGKPAVDVSKRTSNDYSGLERVFKELQRRRDLYRLERSHRDDSEQATNARAVARLERELGE